MTKTTPYNNKMRVQLDMPPVSMDRLNSLKEWTEAASYLEVIRNAIRIYGVIVQEYKSGKEFYIKEEDGSYSRYRMFF